MNIHEIKSKISPEYKISQWINKNIKENYITDIRSNYHLDFKYNKIYSLPRWENNLNENILKEFISSNNIKFAIIKKQDAIYNSNIGKFLIHCGVKVKELNFNMERRNFYFKRKVVYLILKINHDKCN